jgi:hypothetical protein
MLWERLFEAAEGMATGSGGLRERLDNAMQTLHLVNPDDFPRGELRQQFAAIHEVIFSGDIAKTAAQLGDPDAHVLAKRIFDLFVTVARNKHRVRRRRRAPTPTKAGAS